MGQAVFDTSAVLPCFTAHPCSGAAEAALSHFDPVLLTLLQAEFANALRTLVRAKLQSPAAARTLVNLLMTRFRFEPQDKFVESALDLAIAHDHAVYDCLYVAAAQALNLPLITADRKLARKFSAVGGLVIIDLFDLPDPLP